MDSSADDHTHLLAHHNGASSSSDPADSTLLTPHVYKVYRSRWLMLGILVLLQVSNAMVWINFAPLVGAFQTYYHTNVESLDMTSLLFSFVSIPLGLVGAWALNTLGLRKSVQIAAMLNGLGALVRFFGDFLETPHQKLVMVFVGQAIAAAAQPILLDTPTLLASHWFGPSERATANTLGSVANPVGIALGSVFAPLIVTRPDHMRWLLLTMSVPAVLALIMSLLLFKERPPTPPSGGAEYVTDSFRVGLKKLIRNPAYLILAFSFGVGIGLVSAMTTLLGQVTAGQGYTDDEAGLMSLILVVSGLLGAGIAGYIVDKTHRYTEVLKISFSVATCGVVLLAFMNRPNHLGPLMVSFALIGLAAFAALPVALELCVECTFPVNESLGAGLIWIWGQAVNIIFIYSTNALHGEARYYDGKHRLHPPIPSPLPANINKYYDYTNAMYMLAGVTGFATLAFMFFKTEYKRLKAEADQTQNSGAIEGTIQSTSRA